MKKTVGQIVADDYRTAQVFKNYKIDFCCKGNRSIVEVASKYKIDPEQLIDEIKTAARQGDGDKSDFNTWHLDLLADYIEKKHHRYVEGQIPILKQYLAKLCKVHGERLPELFEIQEHFNASGGELTMHMKKEEMILFPWIRKMVEAERQGAELEKPHFGTVKNPIAMMMQEHDNEGERFRVIAELTNNYSPPAEACNTHRVAFSLLKEFEEDLHQHIHLENNILFPKAEAIEHKLVG